uniref:Tc1-like transposase DDE domain-containing protein n=1 Tax=Latimeria chalumnae TaxID=7897 RepID=H3A128_LATCH
MRQAIKEKRRGVFLLHDNAPVHKACVAQAVIHECGFEQLNHPPCSPDLAPSDYHLF